MTSATLPLRRMADREDGQVSVGDKGSRVRCVWDEAKLAAATVTDGAVR